MDNDMLVTLDHNELNQAVKDYLIKIGIDKPVKEITIKAGRKSKTRSSGGNSAIVEVDEMESNVQQLELPLTTNYDDPVQYPEHESSDIEELEEIPEEEQQEEVEEDKSNSLFAL